MKELKAIPVSICARPLTSSIQCVNNIVEEFPRGYPRLAAYVNSDSNTHLYRRFGYARNRLLLYVQDEILYLEERLAELDAADVEREPYHLNSRRWDEEQSPARKLLIAKLKSKMKEYDDMLLREHQLLKVEAAKPKTHRNYFDYIWNEKPLCEEEYRFVYQQDDFLDLGADSERSWHEPMIGLLIWLVPAKILKVLSEIVVRGRRLTKH